VHKYLFGYWPKPLALAIGLILSACSSGPELSSDLPLGLPTAPPDAYVRMCARDASQCPLRADGLMTAGFEVPQAGAPLSKARWAQLNAINSEINQRVRYVSDQDQFGQADVWVPATVEGDCEDYALAKRQLLWAAGWSPHDLSLALVSSPQIGAHAVLIANTAQGAYVLDNASGWVMPWSKTDYTWITAQDADGRWRVAGDNARAVLLAAAFASHQAAGRGTAPTVAFQSASIDAVSGGQKPDVAALEPGSR
jgi:predicted transglutaminase-like cysteine proteinase